MSDEKWEKICNLVKEQIYDEGLWFIDATASEQYLQAALRKLHYLIEEQDDV